MRSKEEVEMIKLMSKKFNIAERTIREHLNEGMTFAEAVRKKNRKQRVISVPMVAEVEEEKPVKTLKEYYERRRIKSKGKLVWIPAGSSGGYYTYAED